MPKTKASEAAALSEATDGDAPGGDVLTPKERRFLSKVSRFLFAIATERRARRARQEGYTSAEHQRGWQWLRLAGGEHVSLDMHHGDLHEVAPADNAEAQAKLREIDTFENTWFPRVRAIIERVVPDEHVDQFLAVFFKDLTQQPLGPTVLLSVTTLLQRIVELDHSKLPGADKVAATLRARNLTPGKIAHIKALIAELQTPTERTSTPTPRATLKARADAAREQRNGYIELVKWYNDWRTTLTPLFVGTDAVALGFARQKGGPRAAEDEDDETPTGGAKPA